MKNNKRPPKSLSIVNPEKSLSEFREQNQTFRSLVKTDMVDKVDYGLIPGTKNKSLWQPGAEKLASFFGLVPKFELVKEVEILEAINKFVYYKYKCTLTHFKTGKLVGEVERSCNSRERSKANTGKSVFDLINTCQAIAQKRAFVAAVRVATMASDFFVSDISNGSTGPATVASDSTRVNQISKLHAVAGPRGFNEENLHKVIFVMYNVRSITELTGNQINELTERLTQEFKIAGKDNNPERFVPKIVSAEVVKVIIKKKTKEEKPYKSEPKMCAQCKKKPADISGKTKGYCSPKCQDKYYPIKKTLEEKLKQRNKIRKGKSNVELITLECGIKAWVDWDSEEECECGEMIYWATTDKNKKKMPVYTVSPGKMDTHFGSCEMANKFRKKSKRKNEV